MLPVERSRVVTISSVGHRIWHRFASTTCNGSAGTTGVAAYGQSKLANLLFTYELQRRLSAKGVPTIAVAAHPGSANTELTRNMPGPIQRPIQFIWGLVTQSPPMGALPTLRAATDPTVQGGQYYGPDGIGEQRGYPKRVESSSQSHDEDLQRRLWTVSEELTGVTFPV